MNIRKHQGMTLIGFLIVVSMVVFFVYLGIRITPIYVEYYSVVSAMNGVADEPGSSRYTPYDIKLKILNRLYVSYSDDNVSEQDIKIIRRNGVEVRIAYEVRKPILGNLDVVASFDRTVLLAN